MLKLMITRSITEYIQTDLDKKIVLLSGPRQCGKTFLSKSMYANNEYLNFDSELDRKKIRSGNWNRDQDLIIFDEIHKMKNWKRWLKGIYDTEGNRPRILATGSARMDTFRKTGDSLAGRHFLFRLHPLTFNEVANSNQDLTPKEIIRRFLEVSNFPEPFLENSPTYYKRWSKGHLDKIIRHDLVELEKVRELKQIEILVELLSESVGSTISYAGLARTLEVSPHTVKKWIQILESLFVIFIVTPYSRGIAKSILKEPKVYFYDIGRVRSGEAAKIENLVACHLLKETHFLEDTQGADTSLHYVKDKNKNEIDFAVIKDKKVHSLVEVKSSKDEVSKSLHSFKEKLKPANTVQVVMNLDREYSTKNGVQVKRLENFLAELE